jgi:hypothetical protein
MHYLKNRALIESGSYCIVRDLGIAKIFGEPGMTKTGKNWGPCTSWLGEAFVAILDGSRNT